MMNLTTIDAVYNRRTLEYACGSFRAGVAPGSALLRNPVLCPLPDGSAVLIGDHTVAQPVRFRIPASLVDDVRHSLNLSTLTETV